MEQDNLTYYEEYKNGNQNIFEDIVDRMILDEVCGMNSSYKKAISSLSNSEKRMAILSLLDKDRKMFLRIKALTNRSINKMDHIKDIILMLREYVKVGEVEKKKFGEVMTPLELVKEMLATLPEEVWSNPNLKWLDPANGTGPYPIMVIYKLMNGLKDWEPDDEKRYKHIVENMIYVCELQPKNMFLYLCAVDPFDTYKLNIYTGSFLEAGFDKHMKEVWGVDKFDIIMGNPPYQSDYVENNTRTKPLYNIFIQKSILLSENIIMITPSRWMTDGFGLESFRDMMFSRKDIKLIKHTQNSQEVFGKSVDIKGGVSYFHIDKSYNGYVDFNGVRCNLNDYDIFVDVEKRDILNKFINIVETSSLSNICKPKSYWMNSNISNLDISKNADNILCYVAKNKGLKRYIKNSSLSNNSKIGIDKYKVFTPTTSGDQKNLGMFGSKIIGLPNEVCSYTYMTLFVDSLEEAKSLVSYMNTSFCNFFLSLRKNSHVMKPDTLKWIPVVPFDREWTDDQLFEYFDLSEEERNIILNHNSK